MKIHTQLKALALLCALPISNTFAAEPAKPYEALAKYGQPAVIPASLQAELKRIDDLPDHKVLTEVAPTSIDVAERLLSGIEDRLKDSHYLLAIPQVKHRRFALKYLAIKKELSLCPAGAVKQTLQIEFDEAENQWEVHRQEVIRCDDNYIKNQPVAAYSFMAYRHNALANQASILLAQKETEKAQWQIKESQLQQEKAQLQAALNGYQLLEDGLQIEGVPNVPGGVKQKLKRSGSF